MEARIAKGTVWVGALAAVALGLFATGARADLIPDGSFGGHHFKHSLLEGLAVDSADNLYVADMSNHRVQKFDSDGNYLMAFGEGISAGQSINPVAVAVDPAGDDVYTVDWGGNRVSRFDASGQRVAQFGWYSWDDPRNLDHATGVAVGADGNLLVVDGGNARIQRFTPDGDRLPGWGTAGSGNGELRNPLAIAVDPNGDVLVADSGNSRIQRFSAEGEYLSRWGSRGTGPGQFMGLQGIAVAPGGDVLAVDDNNDRIQRFTADGQYLGQWGSGGSGDGQFSDPKGLAVNSEGEIFVSEADLEGPQNRVQKFESDGTFVKGWETFGEDRGRFSGPTGIAFGHDGAIFVAESGNVRIQKLTAGGEHILSWGERGQGPGQFSEPADVAVDSEGNVLVSDFRNGRIQKFTPDGEYLTTIGPAGGLGNPKGIGLDGEDNLYVVSVDWSKVIKFDSTGRLVDSWGGEGDGPGEFHSPDDVVVDDEGQVFVSDGYNETIQKFDRDGEYLGTFAQPPILDVEAPLPPDYLLSPAGLAIDAEGLLVVGDASYFGSSSVKRFTTDGEFVDQVTGLELGRPGDWDFVPYAVAADATGKVFVADAPNALIYAFHLGEPPVVEPPDPDPELPPVEPPVDPPVEPPVDLPGVPVEPRATVLKVIAPRSIQMRSGRTKRLIVGVKNLGAGAARSARFCWGSDDRGATKLRRARACFDLGTVAGGAERRLRVPLAAKAGSRGLARLTLRTASGTAGASSSVVRVRFSK